MVSGAGVCIVNEYGRPPRTLGVGLQRPSTILDAELEAIRIALDTVLREKELQKNSVYIYSDSQVGIKLICQSAYPKHYSTQVMIFDIRQQIREVLKLATVKFFYLYKVRAHCGFDGNERGDKAS